MIGLGVLLLGAFVWWIRRREAAGLPALVHPSIFRHATTSAGLPILSTQTFAQAGLLFLIPLFTQSVLGFDALQTGLTLLPLSIGVLITSISTPPLGRRIYPRYIIQGGLVLLFIGGFVLAESLRGATQGSELALGLFIGGIAIGLIAGQLPNLILSGVDPGEASEASGLQGTAQNLGYAFGTAVVGTVILSVALSTIGDRVETSSTIPDPLKTKIDTALTGGLTSADRASVDDDVASAPVEVQEEVDEIYDDAVLRGFQGAIIVGGLVALIGALLAFRLPKRKLPGGAGGTEGMVRDAARNPTIPTVSLEMDDDPRP
jgi:Na+/melibiose symporter-like transporter